ncbi:hypothetical protein ACFQDZ_26410 [Sulfitobacter pacificus]|uniref:hypothetical protein n=1 Tax=Sulfitobacter pacificus TaxID=1499314 RepID=UPI003617C134
MLESIETARVPSDDFADLALELENSRSEIHLQRVLCLPSPAGQNGVALATEGTQQAIQHAKRKPQAAETGGAAVQKHGPVRRANHLLRQSPIHPKIGVPTGSDIRIETSNTAWHRLVQKPILRLIRISGRQ